MGFGSAFFDSDGEGYSFGGATGYRYFDSRHPDSEEQPIPHSWLKWGEQRGCYFQRKIYDSGVMAEKIEIYFRGGFFKRASVEVSVEDLEKAFEERLLLEEARTAQKEKLGNFQFRGTFSKVFVCEPEDLQSPVFLRLEILGKRFKVNEAAARLAKVFDSEISSLKAKTSSALPSGRSKPAVSEAEAKKLLDLLLQIKKESGGDLETGSAVANPVKFFSNLVR